MVITDPSLRWTLSVLFAAATALATARAIRPQGHRGHAAERVTHSLHALMGAAMTAMVWPWGMRLPLLPQAVLFALAAGWFTAAAALQGRGLRARGTTYGSYGPARTHQAFHAVAMGAMAWMVAVMPAAMHPVSVTRDGSSTGSGAEAHSDAHSGGTHLQLADEARAVGLLLCLVLLAATVWWIRQLVSSVQALRTNDRHGPEGLRPALPCGGASSVLRATLDAGCHGVMACGMSVMLLVMV